MNKIKNPLLLESRRALHSNRWLFYPVDLGYGGLGVSGDLSGDPVLTIEITGQDSTLSVYDNSGHRLRQQEEITVIGQQIFSVPTHTLVQGSYLIEVDDGQQKSIARFVV